tara:strand:- start:1414 stop:1659 length:246 start_codon:yes stop_codon:yes gene_type:complete
MNRKQKKAMKDFKASVEKIQNNRKGMGPLSTLTMIFVVLKLTNNLAWSWVYVLSPLWMPGLIVLVIALLIGVPLGVLRYFR